MSKEDLDGNRLTSLAEPTAGLSTFAYAPNSDSEVRGLRQRKETSASTSLFTWDGQNVLLETDANLVTQARFTNYPGIWGGLTSMRRSSGTSFFAFDQQASTRQLLSLAEAITNTYLYTAFGEEVATSGTTENPLRYVGEFGYWRDLDWLLDVRQRYLDTLLGRWLSRDPIAAAAGLWTPIGVMGYVDTRFVVPVRRELHRLTARDVRSLLAWDVWIHSEAETGHLRLRVRQKPGYDYGGSNLVAHIDPTGQDWCSFRRCVHGCVEQVCDRLPPPGRWCTVRTRAVSLLISCRVAQSRRRVSEPRRGIRTGSREGCNARVRGLPRHMQRSRKLPGSACSRCD